MTSCLWKRPVILGVMVLLPCGALLAQAAAEPAKEQGTNRLDLAKLEKVDVDALVRDGNSNGKSDWPSVIKEADERIAAIKARKGYTNLDYDILASPWVRVRQFAELLQKGQPLPSISLGVRTQRNGVFDTGGTKVFHGRAKRAVEIMREIGLKDTANGKSWSDMWEIMDRIPTPLGRMPNGDVALRVDVVLGVNKFFEFVYNQIYNVRDIERYAERDLGDGNYVIIQDLLQDDSDGAAPRCPQRKKRTPKACYPVKEQISITIIHDNKDGTFTLGNFMSTHGQELKAITGGAKFLSNFVDLQKEMEKDTIVNRKKWNEMLPAGPPLSWSHAHKTRQKLWRQIRGGTR